jgi:hypothetical protein
MSVPAEKLDQIPTLFEQAEKHLAVAKEYEITSQAQYEQADTDLSAVMTLHKKLDEMRKDEKKPHDLAAKEVQNKYRDPLDFLTKAKSLLKQSMYNFQEAEEERRKREAEEERKRIERNAEKRAETAIKRGDDDTAHQILQESTIEAQTAKAVISAPTARTTVRKRQKFEAVVLDMRMFLQAALDGKAPLEWITFNQSLANQFAQSTKGQMHVPGISFKDVGSVVASGRR